MPAPEVRAVATQTGGASAVSPNIPASAEAGDLLIMVCESGGPTANTEATNALTAEGWTAAPSSPQFKGNTRLTILYRIMTGGDPNTTNDTGDHQIARIIAIKKGTYNESAPFNVSAGGTQSKTKSVSIPGATTTVNDCLILACASGELPDATSSTEFGEPTNASLTGLVERMDNAMTQGDGGAIYAATGVKATAGAYNATTCTAVTEADRGVISLAISPPITTYNDSGSGAATLSGSASESASATETGAGAVTTGGAGSESAGTSDAASGAVSLAGSAEESAAGIDEGSGTIAIEGFGIEEYAVGYEDVGTGAIELGGSGAEAASADNASIGSLAASGSGVGSHEVADSGVGAIEVLGSGADSAQWTDSNEGVIALAGSGQEQWSSFRIGTATAGMSPTASATAGTSPTATARSEVKP